MNLVLVLGNQLFDPKLLRDKKLNPKSTVFFMREDQEFATYFKFHKHKLIFFFAAMRTYKDELIESGFEVHYESLSSSTNKNQAASYEFSLGEFLLKNKVETVSLYEVEDKFFEKRLIQFFKESKVEVKLWQSPMFLTSRPLFSTYLKSSRKPFMKTFYEQQRKRLKILVEDDKPVGGAWSFDTENRLALPKDKKTPPLPFVKHDKTTLNVVKLVSNAFSDHPGKAEDFWLPVDRKQARKWLATFLEERLYDFGPYEDALSPKSEFVFHSVLTPFLNCGLLTPQEVVKATLDFAKKSDIPLSSLEGFIRQIIGWREFIRGIYQNYSEKQESLNFWKHTNKLSPKWYNGDTGIPPLDETIRRVLKRGYAHHVERLMVVGSLMLLLEIDPHEAHRWFMEMFIDSSDWVMGPNVYGMALFSDGGIFATKPYICGSNYLRKMGGYSKGEWCDGVDGLYWGFIRKHENYFVKNPRLSMMARASQKISKDRWSVLENSALKLRNELVVKI
jgi:deoxyribodipyrimidine photolyase-related protein